MKSAIIICPKLYRLHLYRLVPSNQWRMVFSHSPLYLK